MRALPAFALACAAGDALAAEPVSSGWSGALALLLVVAALAAAAWALRRFVQVRGPGSGFLQVVGALQVGAREKVVVVQAGEVWLVLGVAPGRVNALHTLPREAQGPAPQSGAPVPEFSAWLQRLGIGRHG